MAGREGNTYVIPGAGWPAAPELGLARDECFRVTSILGIIAKPALIGWAGKQEGLAWEAAVREVLAALAEALRHAQAHDGGNSEQVAIDAEGQQTLALIDAGGAIEQSLTSSAEMILAGFAGPAEQVMTDAFVDRVKERKKLAKKDGKSVAQDIGTAAHAWVEWHSRGVAKLEQGPEPECAGPVATIRDAWLDWTSKNKFEPELIEERVYVKAHRWAGTMDIGGHLNGQPTIIDIKSSNGIYEEYLLQVAAYCKAVATSEDSVPDGLIIRLPKTSEEYAKLLDETGQPFEERRFGPEECEVYYRAFLAAKELYEGMRRIKGK